MLTMSRWFIINTDEPNKLSLIHSSRTCWTGFYLSQSIAKRFKRKNLKGKTPLTSFSFSLNTLIFVLDVGRLYLRAATRKTNTSPANSVEAGRGLGWKREPEVNCWYFVTLCIAFPSQNNQRAPRTKKLTRTHDYPEPRCLAWTVGVCQGTCVFSQAFERKPRSKNTSLIPGTGCAQIGRWLVVVALIPQPSRPHKMEKAASRGGRELYDISEDRAPTFYYWDHCFIYILIYYVNWTDSVTVRWGG